MNMVNDEYGGRILPDNGGAAMKRRSLILIWCIGISFIIGITIYSELKTRPKDMLEIRYYPAETSGTTRCCEKEYAVVTTTVPVFRTDSAAAESTVTTTLCRNLNQADAVDLQRVEGIGAVFSERIISARDALGGFTRRAQLLEISGIGEELAARILAEFEIPDELPPLPDVAATSVSSAETTAEPVPTETETTVLSEAAGYYDMNLVTKDELCRIPGMDEETADRILALREQIRYFSNIRELVLIEGLDPTYILTVLAEHLYVADTETTTSLAEES